MDTYKGHIEYRLAGQGSKSEGFVASLITSAGISYRLYRKGAFEINDNFFKPFDQQEVEIRGELEDTGFICVVSVELSDGSSSLCQACPRFHQIWLFIRKMRVRMGQVIEVKKTKPVKNNPVLILRKKKSNNFKRKRK